MNVYFTTSSQGVQKNKGLCRKIVEEIETSGHKITLDWIKMAIHKDNPLKNRKANFETIFKENIQAINSSDVVIFEISYPSMGLGFQIAHAVSRSIPCFCLYNVQEEKPAVISNLVSGIKTKSAIFKVVKYKNNDLSEVIRKIMSVEKAGVPIKFNFIANKEICEYLEKKAKQENISKSELLRNFVIKEMIRKDTNYGE